MTVGTPLWAFVPRPNVLRIGIPVPPGWFPKEGPLPFLWSFQGGSGREIEIPPRIFLRGSGGVFFQFGKNTPPDAAGLPRHPASPRGGVGAYYFLRNSRIVITRI